VTFSDTYARQKMFVWRDVSVAVIGRDDLIVAERASGRDQDLVDAKSLEAAEKLP
jgi:hypothetical protein